MRMNHDLVNSLRTFLIVAILLPVSTAWPASSTSTVQEIHEGDVISKQELLDPLPPTAEVPLARTMSDLVDLKISSVRLMNDGGGKSEKGDLLGVGHVHT